MKLVQTSRDLRVDFFRGLALWWIFIDHMPGNRLSDYTLHDFAISDAAEIFVLLAGYAGGLVYYSRRFRQHGWAYAAASAMQRAWTIYIVHIFLFVVFSTQVAWSAAALNRADFLDEIHVDLLKDAPYEALGRALLLNYQPSFLNILPLYVALLLILAAILPLLRWPRLLIGLSLGLYVVTWVTGLNLPEWPEGGWYFNPFAWQVLFVIGALLAVHTPRVRLPHRLLDVAAVLMLVFGLLVATLVPDHAGFLPVGWVHGLSNLDKTRLHPLRLASVMSMLWLVARLVPQNAGWLRSRLAALPIIAGQHALPVFSASILLSFLGRLVFELDDGWWAQAGVNLGGAAILVGIGVIGAWYRGTTRPGVARLSASSDLSAPPGADTA